MGSEKALEHFEKIIDEESDIFILLEIVEALAKMHSKKSRELLFRLSKYKSKVVSEVAKKALKSCKTAYK